MARGIGSQTIDLVENDCIVMPLQPTGTPQSKGPTELVPLQVDTTLHASTSVAKALRAIMESQQFVGWCNVHFKQYLNARKKKVTQIISYAT